ncbi:amidohydrolase [Acidocella sp. KAb 2-4]|uniref:amidohydrolase n=1 Tax=Acidocella sp. KAb 2-4 TaxID=2885158 RepID=UPI001D07EAB1|nr:amidohydrolase [Acidocella sp. KAb 2-4]MCB5945846.1 amidohydrolase [Acidocella sp. KAb 2-4]
MSAELMFQRLPAPSPALLAELETAYRDLHANPELSMQEQRTAGIAAAWLRAQGYEVTEGVGGTGVVGLLRNGDGPVVLLRADMDALPIRESTGLAYASARTGIDRFGQATSIAHACGHDMHVVWLMGATRILAENRGAWRGTVMAVFQPGEETGQGARAMIEDGMVKRFPKPEVCLGQHVMPVKAGDIGWRSGTALAAGDSWEVTLFGRGAHGSMPQKSVDPVVMAASAVMRLQTVVSREVAMTDSAVVTVGTLQAGTNENIIPDRALLRLNVRTFKEDVRARVLGAIKRILDAEAAASGAPQPPVFSVLSEFPLTRNDEAATRRVVKALEQSLGSERMMEIGTASASEDFGLFGTAWNVPSVFWFVGGTDPEIFRQAQAAGKLDELPANHAPNFAPVIDPTLRTGIETMLAAAAAWLQPAPAEAV